jgi:hypothetical protein
MCSEIETLCRKSQFEGARGWVERAVTHYEHVQAALLAEKAR